MARGFKLPRTPAEQAYKRQDDLVQKKAIPALTYIQIKEQIDARQK
jgi:hypothetical protein